MHTNTSQQWNSRRQPQRYHERHFVDSSDVYGYPGDEPTMATSRKGELGSSTNRSLSIDILSKITPPTHEQVIRAAPTKTVSSIQKEKIDEIERKIDLVEFPRKPMSAFRIFENKSFNVFKKKMPHLSQRELADLLYKKWKHGILASEKSEFSKLAQEAQSTYFEQTEAAQEQVNSLRQKIHEIRFSGDNKAVKPSGKLRFMSAYRFFRREMVP